MIYYTREKLIDVLKEAYPQDYKKYSGFYIDYVFQERSVYGKYVYKDKKIVVSTLSRPSGAIFLSFLIYLSEHIDILQRNETHNDEIYLGVLRKLIDAALKRSIIMKDDLYSLNEKLKDKLQRRYGSFGNWKAADDIQSPYTLIRVYDSIMIRNILKHNGYYYDPDQLCWEKKLQLPDHEEELFLREYQLQADFHMLSSNRFEITPVYKLHLITYSKEHGDFLKSLDYLYDSKRNLWHKNIFAYEFQKETDFISDVPKQRIFITKNQ